MYGTVARMRVRPGMRTVMLSWANYSGLTMRSIPGILDSVIIQIDGKPQEFWMAVVFESEEAYRANADSAEQHDEYLRMLEFLTGPPEWHDGTIIWQD